MSLCNLKEHYVVFLGVGGISIRRERPSSGQTLSVFLTDKQSKQTDLKEQHCFILFYFVYMADPANFLASNGVLGTLFSSENSLFIQLWKKKKNSECVILPHEY